MFPPSPPVFVLYFFIFAPDASIALILALSAVLLCDSFFSRSNKNCTFIIPMADIRVTSANETYQRCLNSKLYFPSTTFGCATEGSDGVAYKFFAAFLLSNTDVGVHFWKDVGLIRSIMVSSKFGSQMSWCVSTNRKDGYRWRCWRITSPSACSASTSIRHGSWLQQSNLYFIEVLFLTYIVRSYEQAREQAASFVNEYDWRFGHCQKPVSGISMCNAQC